MYRFHNMDDSMSLSTDSGLESSEETRPPSSNSENGFEDSSWIDCFGPGFPVDNNEASSLIHCYHLGLMSNDMSVVRISAQQLFHLCRCGYSEILLTILPDLLSSFKAVMNVGDIAKYPDIIHCISGIFYYMTENDNAAYLILPDSYVSYVAKLLSFPLESALYYTVSGLHNLLDHKLLREKFRTPLILTLLIQILWTCFLYDKSFHPPAVNNPYLAFASSTSLSKFLSIVCDSLYMLAHKNEMSKRLIHAKQGVIPLLYFVHTYPFEKTQSVSVRLLRILSTHPQAKHDILKNDPNLLFFKHSADSPFSPLALDAFRTLRNLSDQCTCLSNQTLNDISGFLLRKLEASQPSLLTWERRPHSTPELPDSYTICRCISGTLANFTCRNPFTKLFLVENGAVPLLTHLLTFAVNEMSSHGMLCQHTPIGGACKAPPKYDPIPPSLLSCLCGRRSTTLTTLQATIDCVEAGLRCLSHLTSSHQLANQALHELSCDWPDCVCWIVDLLRLTEHCQLSGGDDHPIHLVPEQQAALNRGPVLHLAKAWLSLARNRLAGGIWQCQEHENTLRTAVRFLEEQMIHFVKGMDSEETAAADVKETVEACCQLFEAIRQL